MRFVSMKLLTDLPEMIEKCRGSLAGIIEELHLNEDDLVEMELWNVWC